MNVYVQLVKAYAVNIESNLVHVVNMLCRGCLANHPSPSEHNVCIMMTQEGRVRHCMEKCLQVLDEENVMKTFITNLDVAEILRCENSLLIYNTQKRKQLWLRKDWIEDVIREIVRITNFNQRF